MSVTCNRCGKELEVTEILGEPAENWQECLYCEECFDIKHGYCEEDEE